MHKYTLPEYICYNWMPCISDHVLDLSEEYYNTAGVSRMHSCNVFDPSKVKNNDLVFIKTDFIINGFFERNFFKKINNRFNIITGVSSYQLGRDDNNKYRNMLDSEKINKWFCVHPPDIEHSKIHPLPIGFQEPDRAGGNQRFLENMSLSRLEFDKKENKIFLPYHDLSTNAKRREQFEFLASFPFVTAQRTKQNLVDYYCSLNKHKFVIGLEGSGPDIHRNYETMLVGSVPINVKNCIYRLFSKHEVDGVFLNKWAEMNTELFDNLLSRKYKTNNNDKFLKIKYHEKYIKNIIKEE